VAAVVLHLAPHPDDEMLGAPATLMALRDGGYRVVNLACSLGRLDQRARREAELREACRLGGFELRIPERPVAMSQGEGGAYEGAAYDALHDLAAEAIAELRPEVVVSPTPHDCHPAHELVGCAVRDAIRARGRSAPRWWMWALWGPLPLPTLGVAFDAARLEEILTALAMHRQELERNDYRRLVGGRAAMYASLGPELLFGFGVPAKPMPSHLELLTEVALADGRWLLGRSRLLDVESPLEDPTEIDVSEWLEAESVAARLRPRVGQPASEPGSRG
jgi:LmbE family N-acetylglucosaminyl deacetylase